MKILNPLNKIVTKKPLVAVTAIVIITMIMLTISIVRPQDEGMDDRAWLPDDETLAALDDIEDSISRLEAKYAISSQDFLATRRHGSSSVIRYCSTQEISHSI